MDDLMLFAFQVGVSVTISAATIIYLGPVLKSLLAQECHGTLPAEYWVRSLTLLMILGPLAGVLLVADLHPTAAFTSPRAIQEMRTEVMALASPVYLAKLADELRASLRIALLGQCVGILAVTCIVWRRMVPPKPAPATDSTDRNANTGYTDPEGEDLSADAEELGQ